MKCESVERRPEFGTETVRLAAVYDGSDENKSFAAATPSASVLMTISNPGAHGAFVEGKSYYVTFEPAPE